MKALNTILYKILIIFLNLTLICAKTVDFQKSPCDNFYEYACCNYKEENPDDNYNEITQKLDYDINKRLIKHIIDSISMRYFDRIQTYYDKMHLYFESCISVQQRNLTKYFDEIKPSDQLNWPLLEHKEQWLGHDTNFDFWPLLGQMQSYGFNNIIVRHEIERNTNKSFNIRLTAAALEDEEENLRETTIWQILLKAMDIQNAETIVKQLSANDLEWQTIRKNYAFTNRTNTVTMEALAKLYPQLKLNLYLKNLLGTELYNLENITIENLEYFEYLNQKLWTAEELEGICNYLMVKFLYYLAQDTTAGFTDIECVKDLRQKFDLAVNYIFYKYILRREVEHFKTALDRMEKEIKLIMLKEFNDNHLNLTREQVNFLENKLNNIYINFGNLPNISDSKAIQAFYQNIPNLERRNYYKNHMLLLQHRFRKSIDPAQYRGHFIMTDNHQGGVTSPFYVPQENMVVIPFGSFQSPLFSNNQTSLQQLSLFGFVLAHELTHAFDANGLYFDEQGLLLNLPSHIMDHANFSNALVCMQQQQPTEDIDERISDLFAVRVVYRTFLENYAKEYKGDWRKEFFRNLAQFFCGKGDLRFVDHDADDIRLQQIVMNFEPFAQAFGCVTGSSMNPKIKCRIY